MHPVCVKAPQSYVIGKPGLLVKQARGRGASVMGGGYATSQMALCSEETGRRMHGCSLLQSPAYAQQLGQDLVMLLLAKKLYLSSRWGALAAQACVRVALRGS